VSGPIEEELATLAAAGVQSLLLEGGPTLAASFLRAGLVDKLLVFVAPRVAGEGPRLFGDFDGSLRLSRFEAARVGEDVLLTAYVHEP
jgi:diaminohydroxyphosphoribosylaminopyrimidine deaminase/5-amino-6-(5-phosphoribosylamino)uracil reductase